MPTTDLTPSQVKTFLRHQGQRHIAQLLAARLPLADAIAQDLQLSTANQNITALKIAFENHQGAGADAIMDAVDSEGVLRAQYSFLNDLEFNDHHIAQEGLGDIIGKIRVYFQERSTKNERLDLGAILSRASAVDTHIDIISRELEGMIRGGTFVESRQNNHLGYFMPADVVIKILKFSQTSLALLASVCAVPLPKTRAEYDAYIHTLNDQLKPLSAYYGTNLNQFGRETVDRTYMYTEAYAMQSMINASLGALGYGNQKFYYEFISEFRKTAITAKLYEAYFNVYSAIRDRRAQLLPLIKNDKVAADEFYTLNRANATLFNVTCMLADYAGGYNIYMIANQVYDIADFMYAS